MQRSDRTIKEITHIQVLEKYDDGILRQRQVLDKAMRERITIDRRNKTVGFDLIKNSIFTGYFLNRVKDQNGKLTLIYEQN
ncbi:hypothetical protein [Nitrosopumilus sp. Nsub]|uniref:hypothetical protein n=1 Tax=Nitrosopumilus sp. Nsub TaxID=1776294 RepID=UPI00082B7931|nr:hypothetical protein [Nitrosopumilus sp. Nsub]